MNVPEKEKKVDQIMGDETFKIKLSSNYSKSKEDVWNELQNFIAEDKSATDKKIVLHSYKWIWIAASLLIVTFSVFSRFYSKVVYCPKGQKETFFLPDESEVIVNADTKIKYYPIWWHISRSLELSGEAYFEVNKGSLFKVKSTLGTTQVLGTSFNVLARGNRYKVTCIEGKVKVISKADKDAVITHGQAVDVLPDGEINVLQKVDTQKRTGWRKNQFTYKSEPLKLVIQEIERQYDVVIEHPEDLSYTFTGSFNTKSKLDKVLEIVCKPFLITFTKVNKKRYRLYLSENKNKYTN
jgi:ferric-dicitrate binding protein FerR (iron transport regulator)